MRPSHTLTLRFGAYELEIYPARVACLSGCVANKDLVTSILVTNSGTNFIYDEYIDDQSRMSVFALLLPF